MAVAYSAQANLTTSFTLAVDTSSLGSDYYGNPYNKLSIQNPTNATVEFKIGNSVTGRSFWIASKAAMIYDEFPIGNGMIYAKLASGTGTVIFTIW